MEYIMLYGFGLIAIFVLAVVMYELGIFNNEMSSVASNGFVSIKPLLTTCKLGNDASFGPGNTGFQCTFINNLGTEAEITDVRLNIYGKTCEFMRAANDDGSVYIGRTCSDDSCSTETVDNSCGGGDCYVPLGKESAFVVRTWSSGGIGPCNSIKAKEAYDVFVDISYNTVVGGTKTGRKTNGKIRLGLE
jgi:hypothetical protein